MFEVLHARIRPLRCVFLQASVAARDLACASLQPQENDVIRQATWMLAVTIAAGAAQAETPDAAPDLGWLAGHWCSEDGDRRVDEVWLGDAGGAMHGLSRTVSGGELESFEFMRIERDAAATRFLAQPGGAAPTAFTLVEYGAQRASFANPAHDFPNRIDYRRDGERLHAQISGPGEGGEMRIPFDYRRCD
jgi:hypothetical protein